MSEDKETKPGTTEEQEKTEKPKKVKSTKKVTKSKEAPKEKKKKTVIKKKKTTKKAVSEAVKETKKKVTTKKVTKKSSGETKKKTKKSTTAKPAKKATTEKKQKKVAPKKEKAEVEKIPKKFTKIQTWVAEAIAALATEDKPWVSYKRIKEYLLNYMDGIVQMIPRQSRNAVSELVKIKLLKQKKESYSFTSKGREKLAPETVPKRRKVDRPAPKKKVVEETPAPPPKDIVSFYGRVCHQVVRT